MKQVHICIKIYICMKQMCVYIYHKCVLYLLNKYYFIILLVCANFPALKFI